MLGLLQALLGARDLDLVAEVVGTRDLDLGGGPELEFLELLPTLPDDVAMVFLGDGHGGGRLPGRRGHRATHETEPVMQCNALDGARDAEQRVR